MALSHSKLVDIKNLTPVNSKLPSLLKRTRTHFFSRTYCSEKCIKYNILECQIKILSLIKENKPQ